MNKKFQIKHFLICFFSGIFFSTLYWLSLSSMLLDILIILIAFPLFVFILQGKEFESFVFNIVSYILGITISFVFEIKYDFWNFLFNLTGSEISAGDGIGVILYTPFYIFFNSLTIIFAFIVTCIRNKKR